MKNVLRKLFLQSLTRLSLDRVMPETIVSSDDVLLVGEERLELKSFSRVIAVAFGKAAFQMTEVMSDILSPLPLSGVLSGAAPGDRTVPGFECFLGGHPYPNSDSFRAGDEIFRLMRTVIPDDLVIFLLSGGGSAMCEKPIFSDVDRDDYREFYQLLVTCGANIVDVNYLRKHFSAIKGGRLTELAFPARQVTIYISDAPPGYPSNVASGPTMPDESTVDDCYAIVRKYALRSRLPTPIRKIFDEGRLPETPKPGDSIFETSSWHCLLGPEDAAEVLSDEARRKGWVVEIDLSVEDDWALHCVTRHLLNRLEKLRQEYPKRTVAIVTGGEYSCPVQGDGIGGRNQAFVLACVPEITDRSMAVLSAGTDGIDGTSPAAGAVADGSTLRRALQMGLNPAEFERRSDSHGFFSRLDDVVMTGPTGNNLRDLRILVAW